MEQSSSIARGAVSRWLADACTRPELLACAIAMALAFSTLGEAPLWYDESGSVWMASLPVARLIAATAGDTHPPLYLLLLSAVQAVGGSSPFVMRLPSVVFALAVIWLSSQICKTLGVTRRAQTIGLLLIALSPFQLHFASEARMYTMLQAEVLLMVWSVLLGWWPVAGAASLLAMYTHNYGCIYAFCGFWLAVWLSRSQDWLDITTSFALPVALWLPWGTVVIDQMRQVAGGYWIHALEVGSVVDVFYKLGWAFSCPAWLQPMGVMIAVGAVMWLCFLSIHDSQVRLITVCALAPLAVVVVASLVWRNILLFRGLSPSVPLLLLALAVAVDRLTLNRRLYLAVIVAPVWVSSLIGFYLWNTEHKSSWEVYVPQVLAQWQAGDVIIHADEGSMMVSHQFSAGLPEYMLPHCGRIEGGLSDSTISAMGMQMLAHDTAWTRAWFFAGLSPTNPACEDERVASMLEMYPHRLVWDLRTDKYVNAKIYLLERPYGKR